MIRDKIASGAVIGLLANIVKLAFNTLASLTGLTSVVFWQIAASRFLDISELTKPIAYLIGGVTDLTITSLIGITFIYLIHYTGRDYLWFKGVGYSMAVWVGLFGTFLSQSRTKISLNSTEIAVTMIAHLIFGVGLAWFTRKFYRLPTKKEPLRTE